MGKWVIGEQHTLEVPEKISSSGLPSSLLLLWETQEGQELGVRGSGRTSFKQPPSPELELCHLGHLGPVTQPGPLHRLGGDRGGNFVYPLEILRGRKRKKKKESERQIIAMIGC